MRTILNINQKWSFTKQTTEIPSTIDSSWDLVNLPHSWNAVTARTAAMTTIAAPATMQS